MDKKSINTVLWVSKSKFRTDIVGEFEPPDSSIARGSPCLRVLCSTKRPTNVESTYPSCLRLGVPSLTHNDVDKYEHTLLIYPETLVHAFVLDEGCSHDPTHRHDRQSAASTFLLIWLHRIQMGCKYPQLHCIALPNHHNNRPSNRKPRPWRWEDHPSTRYSTARVLQLPPTSWRVDDRARLDVARKFAVERVVEVELTLVVARISVDGARVVARSTPELRIDETTVA